jgi:preprotein translocase subunit SecA
MLNPINLISKLFKSQNQKELDRLKKIVAIINNNEEKFKKFTQEEFSNKTIEFKQKIKNG